MKETAPTQRQLMGIALMAVVAIGAFTLTRYRKQTDEFFNGSPQVQKQRAEHYNMLMAEDSFMRCVEKAGQKGTVSAETVKTCKEVADSYWRIPNGSAR